MNKTTRQKYFLKSITIGGNPCASQFHIIAIQVIKDSRNPRYLLFSSTKPFK